MENNTREYELNKCQVVYGKQFIIQIGGSNPHQIYSMPHNSGSTDLKSIEEEKNLGVTFDPSLTFSWHFEIVANKANCKLGLIRSSFIYLDLDTLTTLYKSLVRPHLEYCNTIWSPMYLRLPFN